MGNLDSRVGGQGMIANLYGAQGWGAGGPGGLSLPFLAMRREGDPSQPG